MTETAHNPTLGVGSSHSETLLTQYGRGLRPKGNKALSSAQGRADALVSSFADHATDGYSLAAMVGGGLVYRLGRVGALALGSRFLAPEASVFTSSLVRYGSIGVGFTGEVFTFEAGQRALRVGIGGADSSLLRWSGDNGLGKGLVGAALTLGSLKGTGVFVQGQNPILQHLFQDSAMVLAHNVSGKLGIVNRPRESLPEQLVNAEATLWQMNAGMSLVHGISPRLGHMDRALDLAIRADLMPLNRSSGRSFVGNLSPTALAVALPSERGNPPVEMEGDRSFQRPQISLMSQQGDGPGRADEPNVIVAPEFVAAQPPPSIVGEVIDGRYKVEEMLGYGGIGVVYRATHQVLGKKVAVKLLRPQYSSDPEITQRFLAEAKAAAAIGNLHIIDIGDFGQRPDGSPYFVMEYLEGQSLGHLLTGEQAIPVPRLVRIARQLAQGLSAAHGASIVHRDLKPDNIFLVEREGQKDFVKILDFGIAKVMNTGPSKLTRMGQVFGTPQYMSPEQARGEATVDQRSDIYAFGIILYEMASGQVPFDGDSAIKILHMQLSQAPTPLHELLPPTQQISPALESIIMKCLAKDPAHRFQLMEEVIAALDRIQTGQHKGIETEIVNRQAVAGTETLIREFKRRSRWPLYTALGGGGVAAAVLAAILATRKSETTPVIAPPDPKDLPPLPPLVPVGPKPVVTKEISLVVDPPDAHVFQGDEDLGTKSVVINIEVGKTVELEIRREGFKTQKVKLDASQDEWLVQLEREAPPPPKGSKTKKRPPTPPPSSSKPNPPPLPPPTPTWPDGVDNPWKKKK